MASILNQIPASLRVEQPPPRRLPGNPDRPFLIAPKKQRNLWTPFIPHPKEPDDARITGATRSLDRRLTALNLAGKRTEEMRHTPPSPRTDSRMA